MTDHKPLVTILGPKEGIPTLAAAGLQRWAIILSGYQYTIKFKKMEDHANSDGLSRLPLSVAPGEERDVHATCFYVGQIQSLPLNAEQLGTATQRDPVLSKVVRYKQFGWLTSIDPQLNPFWRRQHELTVEANCLMWGMRVVIPAKYRSHILEKLHLEHSGMTRVKAVARRYVWWPSMDADIEDLVKVCLS